MSVPLTNLEDSVKNISTSSVWQRLSAKLPQLTSFLMNENWEQSLQDKEKDKNTHSYHFYSTAYWSSRGGS